MTAEPHGRVSLEDYLELERSSEEKHEYLDGEVFAMSGASHRHNLIVMNLVGELRARLKDGPCVAYPSDMRVQVSAGEHYAYPDVTVVCEEPRFEGEGQDMLTNPLVVVEVLSKTTESYDRGEKFARYRQVPSLMEVVLVAQDRIGVEHFARQPDGHWLATYAEALDEVVSLPALSCELPVAEIYDKVGLGT
jgi:Uma2 family endonuclease